MSGLNFRAKENPRITTQITKNLPKAKGHLEEITLKGFEIPYIPKIFSVSSFNFPAKSKKSERSAKASDIFMI